MVMNSSRLRSWFNLVRLVHHKHVLDVIHAMIHVYVLWSRWNVLCHGVFYLELWNHDLIKLLKIILTCLCIACGAFVFLISRLQNKISSVAQIFKKWEVALWTHSSQAREPVILKSIPRILFLLDHLGTWLDSVQFQALPIMFKENSFFSSHLFFIFLLVNVYYKNSAILNTFLQRRLWM